MQEGVQRRRRVAHQEPVQDVEAGRVVAEQSRVLPPDGRQPAQPDREHVLEDEAEEEHRDRHPDQGREHRGVVHPGEVAPGRDVAQRDTEPQGEHQGEHRQLDGRGEQSEQLVGHRLAGGGRDTEVAGEDALHVTQVLLPHRSVVAVQLVERRHRVGRGPLTQQRLRGPAGQCPYPQEQQDGQAEQDRHEQQQPPHDEPEHCAPSVDVAVRG